MTAINDLISFIGVATPVTIEGTVATSNARSYGPGISQFGILVRGWVAITPGAGATGMTIRCRNNQTGNTVDAAIVQTGVIAGNTEVVPVSFNDTSTVYEAGPISYRITATQTGSPTAAGSVSGEITTEV